MAEPSISSTRSEAEFAPTFPYLNGEQIVVSDISEIRAGTLTPRVLEKLLDFAPLQVLLKDRDGTYLYVNRSAKSGLDPNGGDPIGMSDMQATPIPAQVEGWRRAEGACMDSARINENDVIWTDLQNRNHVNRVLNIPVCDEKNQVIGVAVIAHDTSYKALLKASEHLMELLQHDWVRNLLSGVINRIDADIRSPSQHSVSEGFGGFSIHNLRKVFEFMEAYLVSLPSVLTGYQPENGRMRPVIDFGPDVISYMQELAPLISLSVDLAFDSSQTFKLNADAKSLRVMCYELMRNHEKYGGGPSVQVKVVEVGAGFVKVDFLSPGERHRDPTAYDQIGTKGKRFITYDDEGNEKDPSGLGSGMYFCRTLALAHNALTERRPDEFRNTVYGAYYSDGEQANVFWFRFPKVEYDKDDKNTDYR